MFFYTIIILTWLTLFQALIEPFWQYATYFDEILVFTCCLRFLQLHFFDNKLAEHLKTTKLFIAVFLVWCFIHYFINDIPLFVIVAQTFIYFKLLIIFLWASHEIITKKREATIIKSFIALCAVVLLFLIINWIFPFEYPKFFHLNMSERSGIIRKTSIFWHSGNLGDFGGVLCLLSFSCFITSNYKHKEADRKKIMLLVTLGIVCILSSLVRKPIVGVLFCIFASTFVLPFSAKAKSLLSIGLIASILLFYFSEIFLNLFDSTYAVFTDKSDSYLRHIQFFNSCLVANDNFPFGSGPGTFLSKMSVTTWISPLYYQYVNLTRMSYFNISDSISGIYDNNIATLIGEVGYIGFSIFIIIFITILKELKINLYGRYCFMSFLLVFYILSVMYATPIFTSGISIVLIGFPLGYGLNKWNHINHISTKHLNKM
jgi:hypothetical protein